MNELFRLSVSGPHAGQPVYALGQPLRAAKIAVIMAHGRGASAADMLSLAESLPQQKIVFLAPQAAASYWYPNPFGAPLESNQPWLDSALEAINAVAAAARDAGIPTEHQFLIGFSQGASLSLEFAARSGLRFAGVAGLAGSLIGPIDTPRNYPATLTGLPVFLGCSDPDPFIPKERVLDSASVFEKLGALVTTRFYPDLGHRVNLDEIRTVTSMLEVIP